MASAVFYFIFVLYLLSYIIIAQTDVTVSIGATLTAGNETFRWLSPSGDFAFGFQELELNKDLFLISIWYDKIPEKTMVWYGEYNGTPALAPRGSQLTLTTDKGLVINGPQGQEIWHPYVGQAEFAGCVMNDTGNFALVSSNSQVLWDSFSHPRDTLLPTQVMEVNGVISSKLSETNFSHGRFQLRLLEDGNLVLNTINLPTNYAYAAYYISGTYDSQNTSNSGYRAIFNQSGNLVVLRRNGLISEIGKAEPVSSEDYYQRITLNFDGVLTQYYYPKASSANETWKPLWSLPDNICVRIFDDLGSGACGFNSICSLADQRPVCTCPQGYSLTDENDKYGNCKPDFNLSCDEETQTQNSTAGVAVYDFFELVDVDWPKSDYEYYKDYSEAECRNSCLNDCLCAVAISRQGCWKKKLPLTNGRHNGLNPSKAFVKYRKGYAPHTPSDSDFPNSDPSVKDNKQNPHRSMGRLVLLGSSLFVNFIFVAAFAFGFYIIYYKKYNRVRGTESDSTMETNLRRFTYKELEEATHNFNEEVGRGAFGIVYKGELPMNTTQSIAVKRLDRVFQDREREFKTEVRVIGQTHHKNLVRLIGFCEEAQHRMLVYEFMNNGTLAKFLFSNMKPNWTQRTKIALAIARGLLYLHEECSTQIIHCDIKPQNVLLDDMSNARISDFGLAKLLMINASHTKTNIRGTKGYVAPEWFRNTPVTAKVDVYSYGVLLLEIICCRKSIDMEMEGEEYAILTDLAFDCYRTGKLDVLVEGDMEAINAIRELEKLVMVAIWCIQEDPTLRPTMRKVTQMLEGVVDVSIPPNPSPGSSIS